jgi:excisionase family DNA binding protein
MAKKSTSKPVSRLPALDMNQRFTVDEAAAYLRVSRAKIYNDVAAGLLQVIKDGSRTFVPGTEIFRRSRLSA